MGCGQRKMSFTQAETQEDLILLITQEKLPYDQLVLELVMKEDESKIKPENIFTENDKNQKAIYELFNRGFCTVQIELKTKSYSNLIELQKKLDYYQLLIQEKNEENISKQQEEMRKFFEKNQKFS